jgi:iron complex transport system substrate-binding protein
MPSLAPERPIDAPDREWAAIVAELTRRRFLTGAGAAGLALGLAACGGRDDQTTGTGAPLATRMVASAGGAVRVPAHPARVVTVNPYPFATMVDLGVAPVGTYDEGEAFVTKPNLSRWRTTPKVGSGGSIDLEKVLELKPDLIIGIDKAPYITGVAAKLRRIAPLVLLPFGGAATWRDWSAVTAEALNRAAGVAALRRRYTDRAAQIRATYADQLARIRWDVVQGGFDEGEFWVYGRRSPIGGVLTDAGARLAPASAAVAGSDVEKLSYERLDALDGADAIAYFVTGDGRPANLGPALVAQRGFRRLPAVRGDRLVPFTEFLPGSYGDALAALDELEAGLKRL